MGITSLRVKNYIFVKDLEIEFHPGLNIITGETGAGKSLIIGSLNLALGERVDWSLLPEKKVEIVLTLKPPEESKKILEELGIETDEELIIRRVLEPAQKKSRSYINSVQVPAGFLKEFTSPLVELHGQHSHQILLDPRTHVDFIDDYGELMKLREEVKEIFLKAKTLQEQLHTLKKEADEVREKEEFLKYKLNELKKAELKKGEEQEIEERVRVLSNFEKLEASIKEVLDELYEGEETVYDKLSRSLHTLEEGEKIDPRLKAEREVIASLLTEIEELWRSLLEYKKGLYYDPVELETLRNRLTFLNQLRAKYRKTIEELVDEIDVIKNTLNEIESFDERIEQKEKELKEAKKKLYEKASLLSEKRKKVKKSLENQITSELHTLGMEKARFEIIISKREIDEKGMDDVEFYISTNPGEPPKPLNKIVSGGELSRVMLAIKTVLSEVDKVPTLVFDEADAGIGGKIAEIVGKKMKKISRKRQLIVITHLPQIAIFGDRHFVVEKIMDKTTTITMKEVQGEERVREVARMLAGEKITNSSIKYAKELLKIGEGV